MQMAALGKVFSAEGIWRDYDFGRPVHLHEITQTSGMVTVSVRDKHIVNCAEIYAQPFCITDKQIAGSCVEQDSMLFRFQQDGESVLRFQCRVIRAVIYKYSPLHALYFNYVISVVPLADALS